MRILGISGSLRKASFNTALLRAVGEVLPEGVSLATADLSEIPLYNADLEAHGEPTSAAALKAGIAASDALLIASPEYNYSVTAALKNSIDWASRPVHDSPLNGKPVGLMGAGGTFGTVRAQAHLRQILLHNGALVLPKPEFYLANAAEKFDGAGRLTDVAARERLWVLVDALVVWVRRLREGSQRRNR